MGKDFIAHFVEFKDWNSALNKLNNMKKARYIQGIVYSLEEPNPSFFNDCHFTAKYDHARYNETYYTIKAEKINGFSTDGVDFHPMSYRFRDGWTRCQGYKITVRGTRLNDEKNGIDDFWRGGFGPVEINSIIDAIVPSYNFNHAHDYKPKFTTLPKELKEAIDNAAKHYDKFGVLIELGDVIVIPYTFCGRARSRVEVVDKITDTRVNNATTEKIVVVHTNNANKKLTFGGLVK